MAFSPSLPIIDRNIARRAAQLVISAGFDATRLGQEMRPEITKAAATAYARKVMSDELVQAEIGGILNRTERNAKKFMDLMWDWLEKAPVEKSDVEQKLTAARILAKGYISEKPEPVERKPMVIEGLGDGIGSLIGEPDSQKKVM